MELIDSDKSRILKSNLKNLLKLLNLSTEEISIEVGVRSKTVEVWTQTTNDHRIQCKNYERLVEFLKEECFILYGTREGIDIAFDEEDLDFVDLVESIIQHRIDQT